MTGNDRAARRSRVRATASFVLAIGIHLVLLASRMPVGSPSPAHAPLDRFVLVDAVVLETPLQPEVPAALPPAAGEPPPVVEPEPLPEPDPTPPEAEPPAADAVPGAVSDVPAASALNEAAVMATAESDPEPAGGGSSPAVVQPAGGTTASESAAPADASAGTARSAEDRYIPFYKVDTKPEFRRRGQLRYPEAARRLGLGGTVVVEADIDEAGIVRAVRVALSAGHGFDEAAMEMVRSSVFSPARAGGKSVPVRARFTVTFKQR